MRGLIPFYLLMAVMIVTALSLRHAGRNTPVSTDDFVAEEINPDAVAEEYHHFVSIPRDSSGFYQVQARIDGHFLDMLIDTGARLVALTPEDADRLDFDVESLTHDVEILTASGQTSGARVWIDKIEIGSVSAHDIEAVILDEGLNRSLLGMSFLSRISRLELTPEQIVLHQ